MAGARSLIATFKELNKTDNKTVAHFTPSLVGMFGSIGIFDTFLQEVDTAIAAGNVPTSLKKRAGNLIGTFIPQVAGYNDIKDTSSAATITDLQNISADSLENRRRGVEIILASLVAILREVDSLPSA